MVVAGVDVCTGTCTFLGVPVVVAGMDVVVGSDCVGSSIS